MDDALQFFQLLNVRVTEEVMKIESNCPMVPWGVKIRNKKVQREFSIYFSLSDNWHQERIVKIVPSHSSVPPRGQKGIF